MIASNFREVVRNTLQGFFDLELPSGLTLKDCSLHERDGKRWIGLPGKAQIDSEGRHASDPNTGKKLYVTIAIPNNCDWEGWNNIGLAIFTASKDGGDGFVIFDAFSAKSPKYDPYATIARWILARADEVIE